MSPSCFITVRITEKSGKRWVVRYRLGGRMTKLRHAGSFRTQKAARERRDFIIGELAAGREPAIALKRLEQTQPRRSMAEWADAYQASRVDYSDETRKNVRSHMHRILATFGSRDPFTITPADITEWVALNALDLAASSVRRYFSTLRLLFDFAGVTPNPARDDQVKLPRVDAEIPSPPSASHVAAILSAVPSSWRLPLRVLEQTGMRVGEAYALEWRDVDLAASRFRIRGGKTRAARRWVACPDWLMRDIAASCPPDDRTAERRVFPAFTPDVAKNVMARACKAAGIPHFHPHDLRHRYASVKIREGVPAPELAAQLGHTRKSLTLDVYSHVLLDEGDRSGEVWVRSDRG